MTGVDINRAAELLYQAHQARVPINPLTERYLLGPEKLGVGMVLVRRSADVCWLAGLAVGFMRQGR
jgi:hypothetical protein